MASVRRERVAEELHAFLAEEVRTLRDPRVQSVSVTSVALSQDYRRARVFWTGFPQEISRMSVGEGAAADAFLTQEEIATISAGLERASGHLKKRIGQELKLRYTPELLFEYDQTLESGTRIDALLHKLKSEDGDTR